MEPGLRSLVSFLGEVHVATLLTYVTEHTLLVTEDGVEILTARLPDSPGGPVARIGVAKIEESNGTAAAA
jgi:hypothetical protein